MRLHRFYIERSGGPGTKKEFTVDSADLANQIRRVFRLKNGDHVILFDGSGLDYECELVEGGGSSVAFRVVSSLPSHYMPVHDLYLCAALTKKDTFEWIVQKATELGVTHLMPVLAERSEKKALNMERLRKIAVEASEQSGRGCVPEIEVIAGLEEVVGKLEVAGLQNEQNRGSKSSEKNICDLKILAMHTEGETFSKKDLIDGPIDGPKAIFIGPEGGWSESEIEMFHKNNIPVRCLGSQILRAETAVVVALSKVVFPN